MTKDLQHLFLLLMCVLLPRVATAQEKLLHGRVLDEATARPLEGAHIRILDRAGGVVTDAQGRFHLPWDQRSVITLQVTHLGYEQLVHRVDTRSHDGSAPLVLTMKRGAKELAPFVVGVRKPEVVYQRQDLHVGGYHANARGLWVLVYERPQLLHREENAGEQLYRNARLHLLDTAFQERASIALPGMVRRLVHDHRHRTIVEGKELAWMADVDDEGIRLARMDRRTLREEVLPWTDSIPGFLLGNNGSAAWPAFDHFAYDPAPDSVHIICSVKDEFVMELFRSQYKYMSGRDKVMAMDMELATGIDREVIAGYMTGFQHDPYFKVPYAPLFVVRDTLCVFDHTGMRLRRFSMQRAPLGDVPLVHQREKGWRKQLVQDPASERIFAVYTRNASTWLREVDAANGQVGSAFKLSYPFPEEIQVFDGHVYYVYRPHGSTQHRTLYREALR